MVEILIKFLQILAEISYNKNFPVVLLVIISKNSRKSVERHEFGVGNRKIYQEFGVSLLSSPAGRARNGTKNYTKNEIKKDTRK